MRYTVSVNKYSHSGSGFTRDVGRDLDREEARELYDREVSHGYHRFVILEDETGRRIASWSAPKDDFGEAAERATWPAAEG